MAQTSNPIIISLTDAIEREARNMARLHLEHELAQQDLPLPKDAALEIHISQIIEADSSFRERARGRVEAKKDAFTMSLAALGVERKEVEIVDTSKLEF